MRDLLMDRLHYRFGIGYMDMLFREHFRLLHDRLGPAVHTDLRL